MLLDPLEPPELPRLESLELSLELELLLELELDELLESLELSDSLTEENDLDWPKLE